MTPSRPHNVNGLNAGTQEGEEQDRLSVSDRDRVEETDGREELSALEKAISELPEDLTNLLILAALEGYCQAEAAELLGISHKAVEIGFSPEKMGTIVF